MLKPKHYPHATVAGALLLTVAPVSLLFLSALWRPPAHVTHQKSVSAGTASDGHWQPDKNEAKASIVPVDNLLHTDPPRAETSPGSTATEIAGTRSDVPAAPSVTSAPLRPFTAGTSILSVRADKPAVPNTPVTPRPLTQESAARLDAVASMRPELTADPIVIADNKAAIIPEDAKQEAVEELEYPTLPPVSETYFMATGHLALANVDQTVPDASPADEVPAADPAGDPPLKPKKTDLVQKNGTRVRETGEVPIMESKPEPTVAKGPTAPAAMVARETGSRTVPLPTPETAVVPDFGEDEFFGTTGKRSRTSSVGGPTADAHFEDVILQTPLETRQVSRVENVIGVSGAQGFPIALVRSDLPDDDWWVQQMVGMRGNTFAARVNFGNEHSIAGSVYHMVVVFLDSPDEARRFRIAKRFDELPEGIRRSREFRYVRK